MNIVYETDILSSVKRKTNSKWLVKFNAPRCVHNGTGADTRQRGGIINNESDGTSHHCFNCGYKASWKPGRRVTYKMKRLMQWLNIPDDTITKVSLAVLETENIRFNRNSPLPKIYK